MGNACRRRANDLKHEFRHRRPHRTRHRLVILAGTAATLAGLWFFVQWRAEAILQREFGRAIGKNYTLEVGRMGMNPLRGSYSAHDIYIRYVGGESLAAGGLPNERSKFAHVPRPARKPLVFSLDELVADGLLYADKSLKIKILHLVKPRVKRGQELRVSIGSVVVNRDSIAAIEFARGRLSIARLSHLNADQSVRTVVENLIADTVTRSVVLARATIEPTYIKEEFAPKSWSHSDWTQVQLGRVALHGIDFARLLNANFRSSEGPITVDSLRIEGGSIASYKDRNVAQSATEKQMYHTVIQRITPSIQIKTLSFTGLDITYEELPDGGTEPGSVTFAKMAGTAVLDGTNVGEVTPPHYSWQTTGFLQDSIRITAQGTVPLVGDTFTLSGEIASCDAAIFNTMSLPLGRIKIVAGRLERFVFSLTGDSQTARAMVEMAYTGLSVAVFGRKHREQKLLTIIANDIMLERTIPSRTATADHTRDPFRSPWNHIWKTIFAAAKGPIGMK